MIYLNWILKSAEFRNLFSNADFFSSLGEPLRLQNILRGWFWKFARIKRSILSQFTSNLHQRLPNNYFIWRHCHIYHTINHFRSILVFFKSRYPFLCFYAPYGFVEFSQSILSTMLDDWSKKVHVFGIFDWFRYYQVICDSLQSYCARPLLVKACHLRNFGLKNTLL